MSRKLVLEGRLEMSPERAVIVTKDKMRGAQTSTEGIRYPDDYTSLFDAVAAHRFPRLVRNRPLSMTLPDVLIRIVDMTED